jgi:hypothetical protein
VDTEFTNLRTGFRCATDGHDLDTATAIAALTTLIGTHILQRYEPVGWPEELVPVATIADVAQLPRLLAAAAACAYSGRPEDAVRYAQAATALLRSELAELS